MSRGNRYSRSDWRMRPPVHPYAKIDPVHSRHLCHICDSPVDPAKVGHVITKRASSWLQERQNYNVSIILAPSAQNSRLSEFFKVVSLKVDSLNSCESVTVLEETLF